MVLIINSLSDSVRQFTVSITSHLAALAYAQEDCFASVLGTRAVTVGKSYLKVSLGMLAGNSREDMAEHVTRTQKRGRKET